MDKQYFNLERYIVLVFTYLPSDRAVVYGNNEQSSIESLQEELGAIIGNNDMDILIFGDMNARSGYLLDYLEDEDKYIQINDVSMNETNHFQNVGRKTKLSIIMVNNE